MVRVKLGGPEGERGSSIILILLMMSSMLAFSAIVVDLGFARQLTRQSQGATDAAALAGAKSLPCSGDASFAYPCDGADFPGKTDNLNNAQNIALDYLASDLTDDGALSYTVCNPGVAVCNRMLGDVEVWITTPYTLSGSTIPDYGLINVKACRTAPTFFAGAIGQSAPYVCRESVARKRVRANGLLRGLVSTEPSGCQALTFSGNSDTILTSNGAVLVESNCTSTSAGAMDATGSSWNLEAGAISVVGSATLQPCSTAQCTNYVVPQTGAEPMGDPFGDIPEPAAPATVYTSVAAACPTVGSAKVCLPGRWTFEFRPGSNDTYLFNPGLYYLDPGAGNDAFDSGGNVNIESNTAFDAALGGPLFFVKTGSFSMNGGGAVALRRHATRPWLGMTVFQSRSNTAGMLINGTANFQMGTIYGPEAKLTMTGAGGGDGVNVTGQIVTRRVEITGSVNIDIQVIEPPDIRASEPDLGLER